METSNKDYGSLGRRKYKTTKLYIWHKLEWSTICTTL